MMSLQSAFDILRTTRQRLTGLVEGLTAEQLSQVPNGFRNNLGWNFAHILVTQQLLTYGRCGLELSLPTDMVSSFRKGSDGSLILTANLAARLPHLALQTANELITDYHSGKLAGFEAYETSYGYHLKSVADAILFNNTHEGLHLGYMMAQKRALGY